MLRQVLKAFGEQNVLSTSLLAEKAGVQESLVLQMLGELVRLGYLEENADCSTSCTGCKQEVMCRPANVRPQRLWVLSSKGREFILDA